jgi:hypothetical protein
MSVDSIAPMQKWEQYERSDEIHLYGLGDSGRTVFHLHHDTRQRENVEEHVVAADSCRKYKSYIFTCQAQTKGGFLALGRSDGAIALYDYVMKSENASCVLDGQPGPVRAIDVSADGGWLCWTTPDFVFFVVLEQAHWLKGKKDKPRAMRLDISPADQLALGLGGAASPQRALATGADAGAKFGRAAREEEEAEEAAAAAEAEAADADAPVNWLPARFDAGTAFGSESVEREILSYVKHVQVRWPIKKLLEAYHADETVFYGLASAVTSGQDSHVAFHRPVLGDVDVVALGGEIVKSLRF